MRCPECNLENAAHAKQCVECGADLTQVALLESTPHRTNQVWNTDIDAESNQKNGRIAMMVLGLAAVLVITLVVALALYLPNVLSYSMDSMELPEINVSAIIEQMEDLFGSETEPAPEPDIPPADRLSGAELDFINSLTAYAMELSYTDDAEQQREIHQMFYPALEQPLTGFFHNETLHDYAWWLLEQVDILATYGVDRMTYNQALYELCTCVLTMHESYGILADMPDVEAYYVEHQQRAETMLEVDYDILDQLDAADSQWSQELGWQVLYYTNNTPYPLNLIFYIDITAADAHYSDKESVEELQTGEVAVIPLKALEKIGDQDHSWEIAWDILSIDGVSVYEYYQ